MKLKPALNTATIHERLICSVDLLQYLPKPCSDHQYYYLYSVRGNIYKITSVDDDETYETDSIFTLSPEVSIHYDTDISGSDPHNVVLKISAFEGDDDCSEDDKIDNLLIIEEV